MIAQIEAFRPDVILNQAMHFIGAESLRHVVGKRCLLVGQIAAPWHEPAGRSRLRSDRHLASELCEEI